MLILVTNLLVNASVVCDMASLLHKL